jgi:2-oxoisovalerate ferredoxin oxidoreductase beta subunit
VSEYEIIKSKSPVFFDRYERKPELQQQTHYCPGCGHGVVHKLIAEALADLGLQDRSIFVSPVGCSVFAYYYFDVGNVQASHGRTPAVATALKRSHPESIVIAYQGDGDLAAIGAAEILHAANRGEKFTVFFINNAIYGMTGGQMAPTTLVGQVSTTTPWGRRPSNEGFPIHMAELVATLEAPAYVERVALCDNKNIMRARKAIRKAIELQRDGIGFSFVEILSPCPTIWNLQPTEAQKFVAEEMVPVFPLAVFRDRKPAAIGNGLPPVRSVAELLGLEDTAGSAEAQAVASSEKPNLTLKIAGFGGQGVLLLGQVLAEMGMIEGREVSWLPSYGPEMRSGSAHCHICISSERVGSPLVEHPDVLVAMNEISLRKFAPEVRHGGVVLYNRDALPAGLSFPHLRVICLSASEVADGLGAAKAANMVMLGAVLELTQVLLPETALRVLKARVRDAALLEIDRRAIEVGVNFARESQAHWKTGASPERLGEYEPICR